MEVARTEDLRAKGPFEVSPGKLRQRSVVQHGREVHQAPHARRGSLLRELRGQSSRKFLDVVHVADVAGLQLNVDGETLE
eukprot:9000280-Pyramimonas_sp.AAC.1